LVLAELMFALRLVLEVELVELVSETTTGVVDDVLVVAAVP